MSLLQHISDVAGYVQLPAQDRRLTFYSEGRNYWRYLEPLITEVLRPGAMPVCFVTSDRGDPGLQISHRNYHRFVIDEGPVRNWLFRHMETDVLVTTMPDLHRFHVKRSRHPVHYVYVQHSLVSLHRVYRAGAFDHYDTIFCAGPHHVGEWRAIEKRRNLDRKELFCHGYGPFDSLRAQQGRADESRTGAAPHVLLAPSWGHSGLVETGVAGAIIARLLARRYKVTLRPHPQTVKLGGDRVAGIASRHAGNRLFACEADVAGQDSLLRAHLMISDWSGAALEFMLALGKPVLYVDVPVKANNDEWRTIGLPPLEETIRGRCHSALLGLGEVDRIHEKIEGLLATANPAIDIRQWVYNPGESGRCGARQLMNILDGGERDQA